MAGLIVLNRDKYPEEIPLIRPITTIGSDPSCEVTIDSAGIKDVHAKVIKQGRDFVLYPVDGSVYVGCKKIKKHTLKDMDAILIGDVTVVFTYDEGLLSRPQKDHDQASSYLVALRDFSAQLMQAKDVKKLLETMLDELLKLFKANTGFVILIDNGDYRTVAARNIGAKIKDELAYSDSIVARVIESKQPQLVVDALNNKEFSNCTSVVNLKLHSVAALPLKIEENLLGVLYLGSNDPLSVFDERDLGTLMIFAGQASLILNYALIMEKLKMDNVQLQKQLSSQRFGDIVGSCESMREVFRMVEKVAPTNVTVLIQGETGTGKELIAQEIHRRSNRAKGPFVAINCGAIPENLLESELFGHVKGAFTGAVASTKGKFQAANGGTLFLDEIGELPLQLQVKLLRVLQEMAVTRVGGTRPEKVDVRVIAATNKDLKKEVEANRFREDLYYRLAVVVIELPPLRERGDDIVLIAKYFLDRFAKELNPKVKGFSKDAIEAMKMYKWPGNVRELENRIKRAVLFASGNLIKPEDLGIQGPSNEILSLIDARERFELEYVMKVLNITGGNRTKAAKLLGVDPRTVYRYIEKYEKLFGKGE